jgi:hypothetical protein
MAAVPNPPRPAAGVVPTSADGTLVAGGVPGDMVLSGETTLVDVAVGTGVSVGRRVAVTVGGSAVGVGVTVGVQAAASMVIATAVFVTIATCSALRAGSQILHAAIKASTPSRISPAMAMAIKTKARFDLACAAASSSGSGSNGPPSGPSPNIRRSSSELIVVAPLCIGQSIGPARSVLLDDF